MGGGEFVKVEPSLIIQHFEDQSKVRVCKALAMDTLRLMPAETAWVVGNGPLYILIKFLMLESILSSSGLECGCVATRSESDRPYL